MGSYGEYKYMIDKDDIYKELTIMENTYMTNGDKNNVQWRGL